MIVRRPAISRSLENKYQSTPTTSARTVKFRLVEPWLNRALNVEQLILVGAMRDPLRNHQHAQNRCEISGMRWKLRVMLICYFVANYASCLGSA